MNEQNKHLEDLTQIRSLMERSSRFISLSGLSGVFAGVFAIIGSLIAYWYIYIYFPNNDKSLILTNLSVFNEMIILLIVDAIVILSLAISFGVFFTTRNSKRKGIPLWDNTAKQLIINLFLPLASGGIFSFLLIIQGATHMVAASTLIFYGLSLINGSRYTLNDIRYLGIIEIALGIMAGIFIGHGLLFWVIGFGFMHIIYGILMYSKYEKNKGQ